MTKGGPELLLDPVAQELLASTIPARLAYNWTDGTPRVVPIWFHWNGTDIVMATPPGAPKLKALRTGDRVAITIDTNNPPQHVLSIRGIAEVTEVRASSLSMRWQRRAISASNRRRPSLRVSGPASRWGVSLSVPSRS
jgi:hypothetical protein